MNIPRFLVGFLIASASAIPFFITSDSSLYAAETIPEALVISGVDAEGDYLYIYGHHFNLGPQDPVVTFEDVSLPLISPPTDEMITADLSSFPSTDGYFLVTVETGISLEHGDTHDLHRGLADPEPFPNQLHIRYHQIALDESADLMRISIFGFDFENGYWPPVVSLGDTALSVDLEESDDTQIVATANIPDLTQPPLLLLTVQTGSELENYDVVMTNIPAPGEPPEPPVEGEQSDEEVGLYWKEGTWKGTWPVICLGVKWFVPKYYELTRDYEIDLSIFVDAYVNGSPLVKLPRMAERYDSYGFPRYVESYFGWMLDLVDPDDIPFTQHTDRGYKWDFISVVKKETGPYAGFPIIKMKKGYRWDGTTRPCRRFEGEFRSGLVHDSMYDLIRIRAIPWQESYSGAGKRQKDRNALNNRELADMLFYWVNLQDRERLGISKPADPDATYYTLQHDGMRRANRHIEELARWRFQTLPDAELSVGKESMDIDEHGYKSLTSECVEPTDYFELDAGLSRPISPGPIDESHYKVDGLEMHETTWQWFLNDKSLAPMKQNKVGQTLDPNILITGMTVAELMTKGMDIGPPNKISLFIDQGKNPSKRKDYYENREDIQVTLNYDSEPPVVSCPADIFAECTGPAGAQVEFDAAASDACEGNLVPTCEPASGTTFKLGETSTSCYAVDGRQNRGDCTFRVTVQDSTPPAITSISATPDSLWPPNNKMMPVEVSVAVSDICDPAPACKITSIASNEPDDDANDSESTGDLTADLRSKRLGTGEGRRYTIAVECSDASGNTSTGVTAVNVQHDLGKLPKK